MKTIQPVKVWHNGAEVDATILVVGIISDNLLDRATFSYSLAKEGIATNLPMPNQSLVGGMIMIDGQDYIDWDTNDYAYNWVASKLNLTITGEYIPPAPPTPPTPVEPTTTTTTTVSE